MLDESQYQQSEKGYYGSTIQDTDLQQKPNAIKFGSIFNLNMLFAISSAILDAQKITVIATMPLALKIQAWNEKPKNTKSGPIFNLIILGGSHSQCAGLNPVSVAI